MKIIITDEDILFQLACRFRGTRDEAERRTIAAEYAAVVDRLIQTGTWDEVPSPEDQLSEEYMSKAFMDYWYA